MANAKISQLPSAGAITGAELAVVVQGGTTSQTTIDDILTGTTLTTVDLGTPTAGDLQNCTALPIVGGTTGTLSVARGGTGITAFGTGVATALGINVGSSGAVVTNGGALGTPSSGTLSGCSGLPISTGVSGLGAGVATFLATPSSANLATAVTGETGSGALVFGTAPSISSPVLVLRITTSGDLGDDTNAINTANKAQGTVVYASDTKLMYVAEGSAAGADWNPSDGSTPISPTAP